MLLAQIAQLYKGKKTMYQIECSIVNTWKKYKKPLKT